MFTAMYLSIRSAFAEVGVSTQFEVPEEIAKSWFQPSPFVVAEKIWAWFFSIQSEPRPHPDMP